MPYRTIPETAIRYGLISFSADGSERTDDPDGVNGRMSERLLKDAASGGFTNIFLFSHGWKGDIPAAIDQYNRWIKAVETGADRAKAAQVFPNFKPLYIGLHWPSLPWGEEEFGGGDSFDAPSSGPQELMNQYLQRLGDTPEIRESLSVIFDEARRNAAADSLTPRAADAYLKLNDALGLGEGGPDAPPDADREPFDPVAAFESSNAEGANFGGFGFGGLLGPLRQLSFWTMKKRARTVGEAGMHSFIRSLQQVSNARIHLMGHSFGCIVVSSILGGPGGKSPLVRPVDSAVLVQGAFSLWSFTQNIPSTGSPGYFSRVVSDGKVSGPIVTTQSRHDTAVGSLYPLAAQVAMQVAFAPGELPKYGSVGTFGIQGLSESLAFSRKMLAATGDYGFEKGRIYNLESSQFIAKMDGISGAHSDIDGPEVAHAIWQAALASA